MIDTNSIIVKQPNNTAERSFDYLDYLEAESIHIFVSSGSGDLGDPRSSSDERMTARQAGGVL